MSPEPRPSINVHVRAQLPVSLGIALLWLVPMLSVFLIVIEERESSVARLWSRYWSVLYVLSLSAWWLLPRKWFKPVPWELRAYRALGVRKFKMFMVGGDRHNARVRANAAGYRVFASESERQRLLKETIAAEKTHTIMLLFALWPTLVGIALGHWTYVAAISVGNIIVNLYPIMLQRDTRARIWGIDTQRRPRHA